MATLNLTDLIISIIATIINVIFLAKAISEYKKSKYSGLKYFILSIVVLLFNGGFAYSQVDTGSNFTITALKSGIDVISLVFSIWLILLFFETFWAETPLNKTNLLLGAFSIIIASGSLVSISAILSMNSGFTVNTGNTSGNASGGGSFQPPTNIYNFAPPTGAMNFLTMFEVFTVLALIGVVIEMILVIIKLTKRIRNGKNKVINKILKRMRIGAIILIPGAVIMPFYSYVGVPVILVGFLIIFISYFRGGLFVLREDILQRLILVNQIGIPLYSFNFQKDLKNKENQQKKKKNQENQAQIESNLAVDDGDQQMDIMFSGALKAISSLLMELTGTNQVLKEIDLDKTKLLVSTVPKFNCSVVLILERSSQFYRAVLKRYSKNILTNVDELPEGRPFDTNQIIEADSLTRRLFDLR